MLQQKFAKIWGIPKSDKFVYGLIDPRDEKLKYIGQTTKGLQRLQIHTYSKSGESPKKINWVNKLKKEGLLFKVVFLEYCSSREELNEAETFFIQYFRGLGCDLLNLNDGGDGHDRQKMSPERLLLHKAKMKIVMNQPEVRKRMSDSHLGQPPSNKGIPHTEETRELLRNNNPTSKSIIDSNGIVYRSIKEAAKLTGYGFNTIKDSIYNRRKSKKSLSFKFYMKNK